MEENVSREWVRMRKFRIKFNIYCPAFQWQGTSSPRTVLSHTWTKKLPILHVDGKHEQFEAQQSSEKESPLPKKKRLVKKSYYVLLKIRLSYQPLCPFPWQNMYTKLGLLNLIKAFDLVFSKDQEQSFSFKPSI